MEHDGHTVCPGQVTIRLRHSKLGDGELVEPLEEQGHVQRLENASVISAQFYAR